MNPVRHDQTSLGLFDCESLPDQNSNAGSANQVTLGAELSVHQPIKDRGVFRKLVWKKSN